MEFERSYDSAIEFLYQNKNLSMFRPKPFAVSYSIRSREFRVVGFYKEYTPTLNARDYKDPKCVIVPVKTKKPDYRNSFSNVIGGIGEKKSNNNTQWYQQDRIYDGRKSIAVCCSAQLPYGSNMYLFEDNKPVRKRIRRVVAMRGRNPNNPSERARSNGNYQQRFEFNSQGICNTLTTVDKDNYLLEVIYG